jgi:hypothetical protein
MFLSLSSDFLDTLYYEYRNSNEYYGISIPEDIKSRFAKGHMAGKESDLVFFLQEV